MHSYSQQFEHARQAVTTITTVRPHLSPSELETLALMLDQDSMKVIEESVADTQSGDFELLEDVIQNS